MALVALAVGLAASSAGQAVAPPEEAPMPPLGPEPVTVVVDIEHSRFSPASFAVVEGTEVRFVVVNTDPIGHELIVGPPEVHDIHRDGTEAAHPPVPGEVSVPPLARAVTSYTFAEAGRVEVACHLPGHYAHGMRGAVDVVPPPPSGR